MGLEGVWSACSSGEQGCAKNVAGVIFFLLHDEPLCSEGGLPLVSQPSPVTRTDVLLFFAGTSRGVSLLSDGALDKVALLSDELSVAALLSDEQRTRDIFCSLKFSDVCLTSWWFLRSSLPPSV
ncbi:hypothetical protein MRX96_027918 [Rhipicephalus microplus]